MKLLISLLLSLLIYKECLLCVLLITYLKHLEIFALIKTQRMFALFIGLFDESSALRFYLLAAWVHNSSRVLRAIWAHLKVGFSLLNNFVFLGFCICRNGRSICLPIIATHEALTFSFHVCFYVWFGGPFRLRQLCGACCNQELRATDDFMCLLAHIPASTHIFADR
jgi:hypothetical protein